MKQQIVAVVRGTLEALPRFEEVSPDQPRELSLGERLLPHTVLAPPPPPVRRPWPGRSMRAQRECAGARLKGASDFSDGGDLCLLPPSLGCDSTGPHVRRRVAIWNRSTSTAPPIC